MIKKVLVVGVGVPFSQVRMVIVVAKDCPADESYNARVKTVPGASNVTAPSHNAHSQELFNVDEQPALASDATRDEETISAQFTSREMLLQEEPIIAEPLKVTSLGCEVGIKS